MSGKTPLILASCSGNVDVVKLLVSCEKTDVNKRDDFGITALDCARQNGLADVFGDILG